MTTTQGHTLAGNSYQASILRHLHDQYGGHLQDTDIGVTRRMWNELGQTAGCHFASVSAALSALENDGRVLTEFGIRGQGGRCRTSVLLVEEPPEGMTVFKGQLVRKEQLAPEPIDGRQPTAEEIANWLLKKTVEASQVPVFDLIASRHHTECLTEDLLAWQELATEYEERMVTLSRELAAVEASRTITVATEPVNTEQLERDLEELSRLERELAQTTRWKDDARRDLTRVRQLLSQAQTRVEELTAENVDLHARVEAALEPVDADHLRRQVHGLETTLEEARRVNAKAERKIRKQAQDHDEIRVALDDAHLALRQANMAMQTIATERDGLKSRLKDVNRQLTLATEYTIELIYPGTELLSHTDRVYVRYAADATHELNQLDHDPSEAEIRAIIARAAAAARDADLTDMTITTHKNKSGQTGRSVTLEIETDDTAD